MGDFFVEQLVKGKSQASQKGIAFILSFLAAVLCFAGFFFKFILLIPGAVLIIAAIIYFRSTDIEYEYCLVNSQFDIDKIIAKSSRKHIISADIKNLELAAPLNSDRLKRYTNIKTFEYISADTKLQTFVFVIRMEKETIKIIINPSNKLMDAVYKMAPGRVFAD